jgi:uncharacterized membrane protein YkoI
MKLSGLLLSGLLVAAALPFASAAVADQPNQTHEKGEEKGEKTVSIDSIPAAARDALRREAGNAPIQTVEQETENGQTVYEGLVQQGNQVIGISVDANGKLISKHSETQEHQNK